MSYKEKPQIKLYKYQNNSFVLQAIIDDFQEVSFEHNLYQAGQFTITINYNIPNALLFERGLFVQIGDNPYDFGEILTIQDSIGEDGKGSQLRTITGYDARYILKRRVIKNMNSNGLWVMTAKGELCLRNLINDQCGTNAEAKRQLPIINTIPSAENAIGKTYSVSEQFTNLYEVCKTIATQSEIGWRIKFDDALTLEVYSGEDLSQTVQFSMSFDSLANGEFSDSSNSFSNAIYVGGKGQNDDRDIYEGEDVQSGTPSGLGRFESWDNQSSMTTESEYEAEALSMLSQYGQTLTMQGNGLAKCPYIFREQYDIGDIITVAFSGKKAVVQILSVTEHWAFGEYEINFSFGKPQPDLNAQLQLILKQIQKASNKGSSTDSVRWYTIPTDSVMPKADVTYNTIGFVGNVGEGATFTLYLDNEKTGAKTYHVWFKQLGGSGKLTLTTGKQGAVNLTMGVGTYVAIISVDEAGNVVNVASTPTNTIAVGNNQPATSGGVALAINNVETSLQPVDTVTSGNLHSVTSNAVARNNVHCIHDYWTGDSNNPYDILALAESFPDMPISASEDIKIRVGSWVTNSPYGAGVQNCDFYYDIRKIGGSKNNWIRIIAYDVRDNHMYENAKANGTWLGWRMIQRIEIAHLTNAIVADNSIPVEWANLMYRNNTYQLYGRVDDWNNPTAVYEGMIIGHLEPSYNASPVWDFPVNVHNFGTNEDFLLWFSNDGTIRLFACGNRTIVLDFYIEVCYVK